MRLSKWNVTITNTRKKINNWNTPFGKEENRAQSDENIIPWRKQDNASVPPWTQLWEGTTLPTHTPSIAQGSRVSAQGGLQTSHCGMTLTETRESCSLSSLWVARRVCQWFPRQVDLAKHYETLHEISSVRTPHGSITRPDVPAPKMLSV